ncbi:MAG: hypothetical protein R3C05_10435 [Pirellulaceae bacterium]
MQLRIEWDAVRLHNDGLQFDGFNWTIDNPIERRDGVSHGGIGGRRIEPESSWFGKEFASLAAVQLDTAARQKSDRMLVFRARYLSGGTTLKRLILPELIGSEAMEETESESHSDGATGTVSVETKQLFQTAYDNEFSSRVSINRAVQQQSIENWSRVLRQKDLTRQQQIFAWWRIGSLAAYNFNAEEGETADNDLAARAFGRVLSIGHDLISWETLNAATVYATLGEDTGQQRAVRLVLGVQWLATRTEAMVEQSARLVNHNGFCIDDRMMLGGMNLQTEAEKRRFINQQLAEARERLAARADMPIMSRFEPVLSPNAIRRSRNQVESILKYPWVSDRCRTMGLAFLDAWDKLQNEAPPHIQAELNADVAAKVTQLQNDLDREHLTIEMKDAICTQQFYSNARSLLRLVGVDWPTPDEIGRNRETCESLLSDFAGRLASKTSQIPLWTAEELLVATIERLNESSLQFFKDNGYRILNNEDLTRMRASLNIALTATEDYFQDGEHIGL